MEHEHERYEQLAVGHVLGGLDVADAAEFRTHLVGCRDCRLRVAELRDIAADLAAAERDERSQAQVRTEVARRADDDDAEAGPGGRRIGPRHVTMAALAVIVFAVGIGFWNLHLRTSAGEYRSVAEYRGETLGHLASGVEVETTFSAGAEGSVVLNDERVAFTLSGLPMPALGEQVVVWLVGGPGGDEPRLVIPAPQLQAGTLAGHVERAGATALVVTQESPPPGEGPSGSELARADLERPTNADAAGE